MLKQIRFSHYDDGERKTETENILLGDKQCLRYFKINEIILRIKQIACRGLLCTLCYHLTGFIPNILMVKSRYFLR